MKSWNRARRRAALAALGCAGLGAAWASQAFAETATVQELIVTGSRLPKADLTADSPIVTVDARQLQAGATLTLETALNRLPQVVPSYSSAANNPSVNGAAYVNLRGLGISRNLVLIDGRRAIGANAANNVDLNTIPNALIDRVEIITGGASAVYGADAVAGVVNVILKKRFDGLEVSGRALESERGDGREQQFSVTGGRSFGQLSLMANLSWARRDEIGKGERDFSSQADSPSSFLPYGTYVTGPNAPSQAAVDSVFSRYGVAPGLVSVRGGGPGFSFNTDGTIFATGFPGNAAFNVQNYRGPDDELVTALYPDVYAYNYQPFNKLILPLERWSAAVFAEDRLSDRTTLFASAMGSRYTAETALAPTPAPTDLNPLYPGLAVFGFTIPVTNPFIPADLAELLASRTRNSPALAGAGPDEEFLYRFRAVQLGPRTSANTAKSGQVLVGLRTDLGHDWRGEAYASHGRYERDERQGGLLSVRRFEQLLDSPTGGTELCDGGFNPFAGSLSEGCRNFLSVEARYSTVVEQTNAVGTVSGPLFRLPAGPVQAVGGVEFRRVRYRFTPPTGLTPGEVSGFIPLTAIQGSIRFADLFAEVAAPLLADRPLAKALDLTLGYRRSDERTTGTVDSYKAELGWSPVAELKVRAAAQRAVRAPDIFERYEPPVADFRPAHDPCSGDSAQRTADVLALCRAQAAALGFAPADADDYVQFGDVGVTLQGNPDVRPEKATTFTLGAVWRPGWDSDWIGGLTATVDGYDIKVSGAIGYQDPQLILNACYNIGGSGNPTYDPTNPACQRIGRSSVDFSIFDIAAPETNQSRLATRGVDLSLSFRTDLAALGGRPWLGRLDTRITASRLIRFREQPSAAQPRIDYAGTIAGYTVAYESLPKWKAEGDIIWSSGPFQFDLAGRFIDKMEARGRRSDPTSSDTGVGAAWYWDLSGRWDMGRGAELRAGVLNLFDRRPEIYFPAVDASTDPSTYDVIGRRYWVALTFRM